MDPQWDEGSPIYRQLRDRVVAMILEGVLKEGDPLPSVRSVAAEFRLNPLTVLKGYQQLVDESLVEKRRGRGMYVNVGARQALMKDEKQRFLDDEWPKVHAVIVRLGLSIDELMKVPPAKNAAPSTAAQLADQALRDELAGGDRDGIADDDFDAGPGTGPRQGDDP
jgi:GntR family transcriptional regulator